MVSDKYKHISQSTATLSSNTSRWIPKEQREKRSNGWIEVVSKHNKRHSTLANDPFAGMKSCVDYEQEIERLKQLVPKVSSTTTTTKATVYKHQGISRSASPDTAHSSDSDSSLPEPPSVISKEERARFLAFVRNWTGDLKGGYGHHDDELMNNNSLWSEQLPWTTRPMNTSHNENSAAVHPLYYPITVQNHPSYYNPINTTTTTTTNYQPSYLDNRQQPIGMGRSSSNSFSSSSLKGRTNSPFVL